MNVEQLEHYIRLRDLYVRHMHILEIQLAKLGPTAPVYIIIELEDVKEQIADIDKKISLFEKESIDIPQFKGSVIELSLKSDFNSFDVELQDAVVRALANLLQIAPDRIKVVKKSPGSVVLKLILPKESAEALIELYKAGSPIVLNVSGIDVQVNNVIANGLLSVESSFEKPVQIFLGHVKKDEINVRSLYNDLLREGFKPWMAQEDILPGEQWKSSIKRAIKKSDFFVVCLSKNSVERRGYLQKEIQDALKLWEEKLEEDIYLIPIRIEDCAVPENLQDFQWVDMFSEGGFSKLVHAINEGRRRLK